MTASMLKVTANSVRPSVQIPPSLYLTENEDQKEAHSCTI